MRNLLHIVHVPFALPYFLGEQYSFLSENNIKPHIICSPGDDFDKYLKDRDLYDCSRSIPIKRSISPLQDVISIILICKFIRKHKIDIVAGHSPKGALLSMIAAFIMRVPKRIYFRHGLVYETSSGIKRQLLIFIEKITALCSTKIVCVSPSVLQQSLKDNLGEPNKHIILGKGTCAGIDVFKKFNPDLIVNNNRTDLFNKLNLCEGRLTIGFSGRLAKDKGIDLLVNAFLELDLVYPDSFQLLLVGSLDDRDPLDEVSIRAIRSNKNIIVTGLVTNKIEYYYSLFDVFVLPSFREGFPTSVLEASSMRIPILTTRVTGCIDSIEEGRTGYYIDLGCKDIFQKISLLSDIETRKSLGEKGRDFVVNNFSNEKVWSEFVKLINY